MAYRKHWTAAAAGETTTSSSAAWTTQVTLTFAAADQDASSDYICFWSADFRCASTTSDVMGRVQKDGADVLAFNHEPHETGSPQDYNTLGGFFRVQTAGTPADITLTIQFKAESNGTTTGCRNGRLTLLKLGANDVYAESAARVTTSTVTPYTDGVSINFTPPSSGDYLILGAAILDSSATTSVFWRLSDGTNTTQAPGFAPSDATTKWPGAIGWVQTALSGSKTYKIQYASGLNTCGIANQALLALRLDGFDGAYTTSLGADDTGTQATYQDSLTLTQTTTANDHLQFAAYWFEGSSTTVSVYAQFAADGASVNESIREAQATTSGSSAIMAFSHQCGALTAASHTWKLQRKSETTSVTTRMKAGAVIVVLDLGAASGSPYTLACGGASYNVSGAAAALKFGRMTATATASYAMTGADAALKRGKMIAGASAAYNLSGSAAAFPRARNMPAAAAAYAVSGAVAALKWSHALVCSTSAYALTGNPVALKGPGATQRWTAGMAFNMSYSNADLTAASTGAYGASMSTIDLGGKRYAEIKIDALDGSEAPQLGVSDSGWSAQDAGHQWGGDTYATGVYELAGGIHIGSANAYVVTIAASAMAANDVLRIAVDIPNDLIWLAWNAGNWNGDSGADPATGTGGISISHIPAGRRYILQSRAGSGDQVTLNSGLTTFAYTAPSGFATDSSTNNYTIACATAAYALTGTAVAPLLGRKVAATTASYNVSGSSVATPRVYRMASATAAYSLSGTAAALKYGRSTAGVSGAYSVSGTDVVFPRARRIAAATESYSVAGTATALNFARRMPAATAAYSVSGASNTLRRGAQAVMDAASYSVSGSAAAFPRTRRLTADASGYVYSGASMAMRWTRQLAATTAAYALTGSAATLSNLRHLTMPAGAGVYVTAGSATAFRLGRVLSAASGAYAVAGAAAALRLSLRGVLANSSYSLTGSAAAFQRPRTFQASAGGYTLNGAPVSAVQGHRLPAASGVYAYSGFALDLIHYVAFVTPPERILAVLADVRALVVAAEARLRAVSAETRALAVDAEGRASDVAAEGRALAVQAEPKTF